MHLIREAGPEEPLLQSMGQVPVMKPAALLNVLWVQDLGHPALDWKHLGLG